jgi:LPXTG-motif cell wall-anchored protein
MRSSLALFSITSWLLACLALAPSAAAQQSPVTVPLTAQNGSGIAGNATLTDLGNNQTRVQISITPATGDHPAHIHMGTCANLDPTPEFPLTNVQNGTSTTVVNQALSTIMRTQRAINLHLSAAEIATYVACGDIPVVGSQPPSSGPAAAQPAAAQPAPAAPAAAQPQVAPAATAPVQVPVALPRTGEAANPALLVIAVGVVLLTLGATLRRVGQKRLS